MGCAIGTNNDPAGYIARLHQIPRALKDTEGVLRQGVKDNLMPVKFLLEKIPAQCEEIIAADPFLLPKNGGGLLPE